MIKLKKNEKEFGIMKYLKNFLLFLVFSLAIFGLNMKISFALTKTEMANKIIRSIQALYDKQKYITVKFEA